MYEKDEGREGYDIITLLHVGSLLQGFVGKCDMMTLDSPIININGRVTKKIMKLYQ